MEHGIITSVNYQQGVVLCDVQAIRVNESYENVPVLKPLGGYVQMPSPQQKVGIVSLDDDDDARFIIGVMSRNRDAAARPDSMAPDEMTIQMDEDTKIDFSKNDNGTYDLDLAASGNITIDGIDFDEHVHSTSESTTGPPE
jgi:hypothetical protein